jgi:histidinol-phosphate aminotransferase
MKPSDRVRKNIWQLPEYVPGEYREGCVKLASNENNYGPSPKVVKTLKEWSGRTQLYPYLDDEVREKIGKYAGVKAGNIVLGNGSDELMDMAVKVFTGPVAGSYPSFSEYPIAAGAVGEEYTAVTLEDDFTFKSERFLKEAGDFGLAFLCSPNNPTGISITDEELKPVLETDRTVVLDEAYFEFSEKTRVKWLKKYPNMIILRTMSKAFALAGLRIGYAIADEESVKAMLKVKIPFNVNSLAEAAALAALDDIPYAEKCVRKIVADRDRIYEAMSAKYKAYPSDSNFTFADVRPLTAQQFADKMLKEKIIVRRFSRFQGYPGEYVRISPGTEKETEKFVEAVSRI